MKHAYLFEAHTIQPYILDSGKLSAMVGASEILEELISKQGPLDIVLKELFLPEELPLTPKKEFSKNNHFCFARRGGGAFFLLFSDLEKAQQLKKIWSLVVSGIAPGLAYSHACSHHAGSQHEAIEMAKKLIHQQRNHLSAELPEVSPWVRRSPRTGQPAVATLREQGKASIWADKAAVIKQKERYAKGKKLSKKFLTGDLDEQYQFPLNLEHNSEKQENTSFPFNDDNHNLGIIHADGNGLGQILISLADKLDKTSDDYAAIFYELSTKIDKATQQAARRALEPAIKLAHIKTLPVRPLILGGDDLTMIVRADLALEYARDFMTFFEQETEQELKQLHLKYKQIPAKMTACAGIAFIKSNQPFSLGYALAESLCKAAKNKSRQHLNGDIIPGSLVFHRVTSSYIDQYDNALDRELTVKHVEHIEHVEHVEHVETEIQLTLGAYGVGAFATELPQFNTLEALKNVFIQPDMAKGPTRQFLTLASIDLLEATETWRRWRKTMGKSELLKPYLAHYDELAQQLARDIPDHLLFMPDKIPDDMADKTSKKVTFIGDLINWMAATGAQK